MLLVFRQRHLGAALAAVVAAAVLLGWAGTRLAHAGGSDLPQPTAASAVVWRVPTTAAMVAITFDDGPDPTYTPQMLAELAGHGAVGTFFVLGSAAVRYPALVRAEVAQGSQVCNHGYTHAILRGKSQDAVTRDVERTATALEQIGVPDCRLFRFPYFASDAAARTTVAALGYRMIGANIDTLDWRRSAAAGIADEVLGRLRPGDIVLLHDGGGPRSRSVQALNLILAGMARRGLRAVTVGQLLAAASSGASGTAK